MNTVASKNIIAFPQFAEICGAHGLKATQQRFEIYSELLKSTAHPDTETVYVEIRKRMPSISFDTVYRTVRVLEEKGVILRIDPGFERARYDANMSMHHHFICRKCGMIKDFSSEDFDRISPPDAIDEIGKADCVHVEIRGVCNKCKSKK
ncbi:MAG: Fur family transcriptional regulator [Victivallales bacterium]|jgi:Fur family peroxide stress response transcriptional regulator